MKILWQSKSSKVMQAFYEGLAVTGINGGNAYDVQAALAISKKYKIEIDPQCIRKNEGLISYWKRMNAYRANADLLIMEPFPIVYGKRKVGQKSIAVIHHIDHAIAKKTLYHRWYFHRLMKKVKACDSIVTVSEHWRKYFLALGCKSVHVIYNAFDPAKYGKMDEAEISFRQRMGIPINKKIIYVGNAIPEKGVVEVYDALKNSEYHLIMTGPKNRVPDLNVHYVNMKREDYLRLLTISSLVICFSLMEEGWNRIAHEALLSGTPVIGSGTGGMRELLEKSGQLIVTDKNELKKNVEKVLANREKYAAEGISFVKQFDMAYFERSWIKAVDEVLAEN